MDAQRRLVLGQLAALAAAGCGVGQAVAASKPIVVLTAYAEEVLTRFEAAFERAYPGQRLQIVWRMPHDALPYVAGGNPNGVDVVWLASPRTFAALKQQNQLQPLPIDRAGLPAQIGGSRLADPDGRYLATEMAAYGLAYNPAVLQRLGVGVPVDWSDLLDPRLAGQIVLPVPSQVGFAPVMFDIVLQWRGWDAGWALISELAGLSVLSGRGASFVSDEVASGRAALGLSIDFFVASAIANGSPVRFAYPRHSGINPGHIAVPVGAPNLAGALDFVRFVLSDAGQRLLVDADIRKLPVRPSAYQAAPATYYRPFDSAAAGGLAYDNDAGQPRLGLIAAVFDAMLASNHEQLVALWRRVHAAERAGQQAGKAHPGVAQARAALSKVPLSAAEAERPELQRVFKRLEGGQASEPAAQAEWRAASAAAREQAQRFLDEASA